MPWHVLVYHHKPSPNDPWPLIDRVFRDGDFANSAALLEAVSQASNDLRRSYPPPDYTIACGSGPESTSDEFPAFVVWLLREE